MAKTTNIATNSITSWDEILGSKNWDGLVEPQLDLSLRQFILTCGNFCQATADAFVSSDIYPNCGNSRYEMPTFFQDVILQNSSHYRVEAFLTAPSGLINVITPQKLLRSALFESNWIGYVAVTTDEYSQSIGRRIVFVVWRGTFRMSEWVSNIAGAFNFTSASPLLNNDKTNYKKRIAAFGDDDEPRVHGGWLHMYNSGLFVNSSARQQLWAAIQNLTKTYATDKLELSVVVTGHSLGGALATLSAFDLAENIVAGPNTRVAAFVFGCPQAGNEAFNKAAHALPMLKILSVRNKRDIVPKLPDDIPYIGPLIYKITGSHYVPIETVGLQIDTDLSPFLKSVSAIIKVSGIQKAIAEDPEVISFQSTLENLSPSDFQSLRKSHEDITPVIRDIDINNRDEVESLRALSPSSVISTLIPLFFKLLKEKIEALLETASDFHNLEATLHVVAWWVGPDKPFSSGPFVQRSLALVNRSSAFLKDELKTPSSWWTPRNKGMVYEEDTNEWVLD